MLEAYWQENEIKWIKGTNKDYVNTLHVITHLLQKTE